MDKNTSCEICVKEFFKASNLRRHVMRFHPETFKPLPKKQFAFTCDVCGKNFSYIRNFRCHVKTHETNPQQTKMTKKCPLCSFVAEKTELCQHFTGYHDIQLIMEKLQFKDTQSFMVWKLSIENDTHSQFVRSYMQQTKFYDEVIFYVCHRSGHYFPKIKKMERMKNDYATKKIGGFCPASIKMMKKYDGSILVFFSQTHVGHSNKEVDGCRELTKKLKSIQMRHKKSCSLDVGCLVKSENVWQFHSQNKDEVFVISAQENQCGSECPLTCKDCKTCVHRFSCSCKDWTVKWNMCVHIHLLCTLLNEEQEQMLTERPGSSLDISDLLIYDGGGAEERVGNEPENPIIIQEVQPVMPIEEKNMILQQFSDILFKSNSPSLLQEIVTFVSDLKARVDCEEISTPNQTFVN